MHSKYTPLTPKLYSYLLEHCSPIDGVLDELVTKTEEEAGLAAVMQVAQDQGSFLTMLVRIVGARQAVEIGTFTGYSSICIARGLAADGRLLCCDSSERWISIAREYWRLAGVEAKIDVGIGPALDTLNSLPAETRFDFAFVDADKENYRNYYEQLLVRMDSGGLILFDNVFWGGAVIDSEKSDAETDGIRLLNDALACDPRVEVVVLALGDGVTIARKR